MPIKHPKSRFGKTIPKKARQKRQKPSSVHGPNGANTKSKRGRKFPGVSFGLRKQFGPPVFLNAKGEPTKLNEPFWAALYAAENIVLYEPEEKEFYAYDSTTGLYLLRSVDTIRTQLAARIRQAATAWPNGFKLLKLATERNLHGIISFLRGQVETADAFKRTQNFIHLANGVLVFKNQNFKFEKFSPDFRSRNQSPVAYDQNATAPTFFNDFLAPLHADDRALIQKYFGQALLGRNITQTILLLDGETDTGKSTLVKIIGQVVGLKNSYQLRTYLLKERFEIGRYIGKTLLLAPDVDTKFLSAESASLLKPLVGGDFVPAELKKSNATLSVEGIFNIIISSNGRLLVHLEGDTEAWRRRLLLVRYQTPRTGATIEDFDKILVDKEGSGILNFALFGLLKLFADLAQNNGRIHLSTEQKKRINKLLDESDSLLLFLKNSLIPDPNSDLTVKEIVERYFSDCLNHGLSPIHLDTVSRILPALMSELFGVLRVNDIRRLGKNQRGFSQVKFI
jgi:hypothetical protein